MTDTITKPLVWVETGHEHWAGTPFGEYLIDDQGGNWGEDRYWLSGPNPLQKFPTLDAARAAAQADCESRARAMLSDETLAKLDEVDRLREAITPSAGTKAAFSCEFWEEIETLNPDYYEYDEDNEEEDEDNEEVIRVRVPIQWETIKAIMAAICARAALSKAEGRS